MGKEYTPQAIRERLLDNQRYGGYVPFHKPKYTPLLLLKIEYPKMRRMDDIQILFEVIIKLCKLITGNNISPASPRPLSPEMRQEVIKLNKTFDEYKFLCEKQIDSPQERVSFISETREQISALEKKGKRYITATVTRKVKLLISKREILPQKSSLCEKNYPLQRQFLTRY